MPGSAANLKRDGVQVVEGAGLVASGVQFITRLAVVFTDEFAPRAKNIMTPRSKLNLKGKVK